MSEVISIKFNASNKLHYIVKPDVELEKNTKIIVTTTRGKEIAQVENVGLQMADENLSPFVLEFDRIATQEDLQKEKELLSKRNYVIETTINLVKKFELDMKIVDAEFTIDGQKVIISFVCEDRVDFRELVKELANILKLRIELKQIGARDQAKTVGGIGCCGEICCCIRFLNEFDKVSIKMAKTQNLSLNPAKISGICGRLMCCLAYENDHYAETQSVMPKVNSKVGTPMGEGVVIYNNLLKRISTVKFENEDEVKYVEFPVNELKITTFAGPCPKKENYVIEKENENEEVEFEDDFA